MHVDVLRLYERWGWEYTVRPGRNGDEAWACCVFHGEEHPSFSVNMETGKWFCMACHERGRSIESLVRKVEGIESDADVQDFLLAVGTRSTDEIRSGLLSKIDALKAKREKAYRVSVLGEERDTRQCDEYRKYVRKTHGYLPGRGFDQSTIGKHRIGYDPKKRDVTIPVFEHGTCRFMYRRTVTDRKPSYMYPSDVDKSNYLWGLDRPEGEYRDKPIYVTEGGLDALWLKQCGYEGAVAILGSFMSETQASKIAALDPSEVVMFFDADEAGHDATETSGAMLLKHGVRKVYYLRYLASSDGDDPATCSPSDIKKMVKRKRHYHHFRLASEVGRKTRIRNLLSIAHSNNK